MAKSASKSNSNISFRERLSALRNLPELFRLVWQSSPGKTTVSFLLRIARSAMPVALLLRREADHRPGGWAQQARREPARTLEISDHRIPAGCFNRWPEPGDQFGRRPAGRPVFQLHVHEDYAPCGNARPGPV